MKLKAYLELVRLPNGFTAIADVAAGYWILSHEFRFTPTFGWIALTSAALYSAGIVLNDLCDVEADRCERPTRPLPSCRITINAARMLCVTLIVMAIASATMAGREMQLSIRHPACIALMILVLIFAYDLWSKATMLGPFNMGACRALNLLLGASVGSAAQQGEAPPELAFMALALFTYVSSFTYFGREEAGQSQRRRLVIGGIGAIAGILILGVATGQRLAVDAPAFILWLALLIHIFRVVTRTIRRPDQSAVQYGMKTFILAIIVFDATLAASAHGWQAGLCLIALLIPAIASGRWIYST